MTPRTRSTLVALIVIATVVGLALPSAAATTGGRASDATLRSSSRTVGPPSGEGPTEPAVGEAAYLYANCTGSPAALFAGTFPDFSLTEDWAGSILDECSNSSLNGAGFNITSSSAFQYGLQVNWTANVTVSDLRVDGSPTYGVDVRNSSEVRVSDIAVAPGIDYGLFAASDSGLSVNDLQANGSAELGADLLLVQGGLVQGSFADNATEGFGISGSGDVLLSGSTSLGSDDGAFVTVSSDVSLVDDDLASSLTCGIYALYDRGLDAAGVDAADSHDGVCDAGSSEVTITGSDFAGAAFNGINATVAEGLNATDVNLSDSGHDGALITQSSGVWLGSATANGAGDDGFDIENSSGVTVVDSSGTHDEHNGLRIAGSLAVTSRGDRFDDGTSASVNGTSVDRSSNVVLAGDVDDGNLVGVYDTGSTGLTVTAVNASLDYWGFLLVNDRDVAIQDSTAAWDTYGGTLVGSTDSEVFDLAVYDPVAYGILLEAANFDSVRNSTVLGNASALPGYGIYVDICESDSLVNDTVIGADYGLASLEWFNSTVTDVTVRGGVEAALHLVETFNLTVSGGNFSSSAIGLLLTSLDGYDQIIGNSFDNDSLDFEFATEDLFGVQIYWNNFIDGGGWSVTVTGDPNGSVQFADGYPGGGNYWSNFTTPDVEHGPLQNLPGGDGIVDVPLPIQGTLEDPYPLTRPISLADLSVEFLETGLPDGLGWNVTFGSVTAGTTSTSLAFSTGIAATGVDLHWVVRSPPGYEAEPGLGHVITSGEPHVIDLRFLTENWTVTINQTGLGPSGQWSLTIDGTRYYGIGNSLTIDLPNGTYDFAVTPIPGYTTSPATGNFTVTPSGGTLDLVFTQVVYTVSFTEQGLPSGTVWYVTFNGSAKSASEPTIEFIVPNGSYEFAVGPISGFVLAGGTGTQSIAGFGAAIGVAFAAVPPTPASNTSPTSLEWGLIALVVVLALALVAAVIRGRKKEPPTAAPWSPPPSGGPGGPAVVPPPNEVAAPPAEAATPPPAWKE